MPPSSSMPHQISLSESDQPTRWYNILHDLPTPAAAGPAPRHRPAGGARRPLAALPDGPDPPGGLRRPVRRDPRRGARRLPPLATLAAVPRPPAREGARHAGADLLQVRGREPGRLAQAEHGRAAGLLQRQGRHQEAHHRDRRRPVGHGPGLRLRAVRPRVRGVAGAGVVRPEALPADDDRDLRRHGAPQPERPDERRPHDLGAGPRQHRQPRHRDQRGGRDGGRRPDDELRARQRAQPRPPAPDGDRRGGAAAAGAGRRDAGPPRRLHRRRVELRRARVPVPAREVGGPDVADDPRRRAGVVPVADPGHLRLRLRRHPRDDAPDEDAHARATTSSRSPSTPAACATTA